MSKHRQTLLLNLIWTLRDMRIGKAERKESEIIDMTGLDVHQPNTPRKLTHLLEK